MDNPQGARSEMNQPTDKQRQWLWEQCGLVKKYPHKEYYEPDNWYIYPDGTEGNYPPIDLNFLFELAVPTAIAKLESRFDTETNLIRGLELLFQFWLDNIREGLSFGDALFWACFKALGGK